VIPGVGPVQASVLVYVRANPGCSINSTTRWHRWGAQRSAYALERRGLLIIDRRARPGRQGFALCASQSARELAELIDQAEREPDLVRRTELIDQLGPLIRAQVEQFKADSKYDISPYQELLIMRCDEDEYPQSPADAPDCQDCKIWALAGVRYLEDGIDWVPVTIEEWLTVAEAEEPAVAMKSARPGTSRPQNLSAATYRTSRGSSCNPGNSR
jgi:hypothetical protein